MTDAPWARSALHSPYSSNSGERWASAERTKWHSWRARGPHPIMARRGDTNGPLQCTWLAVGVLLGERWIAAPRGEYAYVSAQRTLHAPLTIQAVF